MADHAKHLPTAAKDFEVFAYTDGGCRGNPGVGGWAFVLVKSDNHHALERTGGEQETTNNRMEMLAAIEALRALTKTGLKVLIHSDSQYLIKAASEWIPGWKARGWKRKDGPLKNVDLLQEIDRLTALHQVTWRWVEGHAGNRGNERVDQLANEAMDRIRAGADPRWERRTTW